MINYKVVVHRDHFGTKAIFVERNVDSRKLSQIIYGLTCEYPGCHITLSPEQNIILTKSASIFKQLQNLNIRKNSQPLDLTSMNLHVRL